MRVTINLNARALVLVDQLPVRYLGAGRHRIATAPWREVEVRRYDAERLLAELRPEELALVPERDFSRLALTYELLRVLGRSRVQDDTAWTPPGQGGGISSAFGGSLTVAAPWSDIRQTMAGATARRRSSGSHAERTHQHEHARSLQSIEFLEIHQ